uniref:Uncharacterized protein n=1 Tax=Globodera rostochiensis TaxID=31243 RepID=A0A914H178_GLORO
MNFATQFLIFLVIIALVAQSVWGGNCFWGFSDSSSDGPYGEFRDTLDRTRPAKKEVRHKVNNWKKGNVARASSSKSKTSASLKRRNTI